MKRFLTLILFFLWAIAARAQVITETITLTNTPADGDTIVVNGVTRTWKTTVATPATQIQVTNSVGWAATNLYQQIAANPYSGPLILRYAATNAVSLASQCGGNIVATFTGTAISTNITSQSCGNGIAVRIPVSIEPTLSVRTNIASGLVTAIGTWPSNTFGVSSPAFSNFVGISSGKTITGTNLFTGPNTLSNANQFITGGGISNVAFTNVTWLQGSNGLIALILIDRSAVSNATWLSGTNGTYYALGLSSPVITNGQNYGQPFRSPGLGSLSEQFGASALALTNFASAFGHGAYASGINSTAVGSVADATNSYTTALGYQSLAGGIYSVAIGDAALSLGSGDTSLGTSASATGGNGTALGSSATANQGSDTAVGASATTARPHEIALGTSSEFVHGYGGAIFDGGITNLYNRGSNTLDGSLNYVRKDVTGLANGGNIVNISTNVYINVSGPTGAFSVDSMPGGGNGRIIIIQNATGQTMTIKNASGFDSTAANRILTGTGADVSVTSNPGAAQFIYDSSASRWTLLNHN